MEMRREAEMKLRSPCRGVLTTFLAHAVISTAWLHGADAPAQHLTQYGITWTFDRTVQAGQFVNGCLLYTSPSPRD